MDAGQALLLQGDALKLPLPDASVDLIVTSPPYWALRAYGITCRMCEDVVAAGGDPRTAFVANPSTSNVYPLTGWDDHVARFHREVGSESTPQEYLEALWAATAEMARVLKPPGSIFVDLGDKYGRPGGGADVSPRSLDGIGQGATKRLATPAGTDGVRDKSLMLLPERYRVGCVDRLGLIARAVIVWNKPNGLPESVTDRVRRSHEDWVHLVKQPRYYSATDEVREAYEGKPQRRLTPAPQAPYYRTDAAAADPSRGEPGNMLRSRLWDEPKAGANPLGKLPGSVWTIPSEPLRLPDHLGVQHYAAFPSEWPRRLILGWSPPGICLECGQGRVPVVERERPEEQERIDKVAGRSGLGSPRRGTGPTGNGLNVQPTTILGYACSCTPFTDHPGTGESSGVSYAASLAQGEGYPGTSREHGPNRGAIGGPNLSNRPKVGPWREYHLQGWTPPPTRPAVILDPFGGTGTTAMVARALGRIGVSVDLSHAYGKAARWRVHHDGAKAISRTNLERQGSLL